MTIGVEDLEKFNHFVHTAMPEEERKNIHDDILVKLTDNVNKLIHEAQKKRPDKRIGILITPSGFFSDITVTSLLVRNG